MIESLLATTITMVMAAAQAQSPASKPAPADVGDGRVAWFDITTSDLAASRQFYAKLFDWQFHALQGTDMAVEVVAKDVAIGTLRVVEGKVAPYNGVVYIQVADIEASCVKAKALGGTVPPGFPFNLQDRPGAVAVVIDPIGHPVGLYSRKAVAPARR